jgi:outer membrane protein assembly factor BamB
VRISTVGVPVAAILALVLGACGGGGGGGDTTTQPAPVLGSLSPSSASAGTSGITVTVTGSNFTAQSVVQVSSSPRTTTFVSASQLSVQLTAADLASPGQLPVSVAQPNSPPSNPLTFTINAVPPSLSAYSPTQVDAGGGNFMLTVLGKAFTASSVVRWNGASRPTTFVSATEVIAQIPASDIANVGSATIDVSNGASGVTSAVTVQIEAPSKDAVSLQINTAHTGGVTFQSITFPSTSTWSVDVGGPPSVALIAGGKVFVTAAIPAVSGGAPTTTLLALDAATGATVWTASTFYPASLAYDSGKLILLSQTPADSAIVYILDAGTGNALGPQVELVSNDHFYSAPVARDGLVFVAGAGNLGGVDGPWLYAISEQTGAVVWAQPVGSALSMSTPIVTVDGVYLSYAGLVYAFRPLTGEMIWSGTSTTPPADGGATGVVANGSFFAPDAANTYNGHIYSAATGAQQGTYTADGPPAIGTQAGYFLSGGTLSALSLNGYASLWTFTGDGHLATSPLLVGSYVIVGSDTGNLYALDATSGTQAWQINVGAPLPKALGYAAVTPYSGMSAGDGLLVVPSGNSVVAYTLSTNP